MKLEQLLQLWTWDMKLGKKRDFEIIKFYEMCAKFDNAHILDNRTIMLEILTNFFEESLLREKEMRLTKKQMFVVLFKVTYYSDKFLTETIEQYPSLKDAMRFIIVSGVEQQERDQQNIYRDSWSLKCFHYKMMLFKSIVPDLESSLKLRIDKLIVYSREKYKLDTKNSGTPVIEESVTTLNWLSGHIKIFAFEVLRCVAKYRM